MKKKYIGIIICAVLVVVAAVVLTAVLHRNADEETGTQDVTPTATLAPTKEPTAMPTEEPTKKPTMEPTEVPTPSPTAIPTATPVPTATSTPTPKPSPTPTITPVPTEAPVVKEDTIMIGEYEIPATHVYNGTEYPWFKETDTIIWAEKMGEDTYCVAYADKNNKSQLTIINTSNGKSIGCDVNDKDLSHMSVTDSVAYMTESFSRYYTQEELLSDFNVSSSCMPTPTPTPTPFPTPNPEQPKILASYKGDKDYGTVTVEAWDNGYLYIKGTGAYNKKTSMDYHPKDLMDYLDIVKASGCKIKSIVVEEGITGFAYRFPAWTNSYDDIEATTVNVSFPSTFEYISKHSLVEVFANDVTITGYKNGEKTTFLLNAGDNLYDALKEKLDIEIK